MSETWLEEKGWDKIKKSTSKRICTEHAMGEKEKQKGKSDGMIMGIRVEMVKRKDERKAEKRE